MTSLKSIIKNTLPYKLYKSRKNRKLSSNELDECVKQYFDKNSLVHLYSYPGFTKGEVAFLGKKVQFSHAPSFLHSIEEIFCEEVYSFESANRHPYILDCGANIGLSVIYFKQLFPQAKILAFEPDKQIFKLLENNIQAFNFSDVELMNKAVWNKNEEITFYHEGALAGSVTTDFANKKDTTTISAIDFLSFVDQPIDFLKIDIEGAEYEVLKHIAGKLPNVEKLFVEFHGDLNKPQQLHQLLEIVANAGFRYYIREAAYLVKSPFSNSFRGPYDLQLNIFCYR